MGKQEGSREVLAANLLLHLRRAAPKTACAPHRQQKAQADRVALLLSPRF